MNLNVAAACGGRAESVPVEVKKPADMYSEGNLSSDYWYRNI